VGDQVEMSTWATIWQATGEEWKDVRCQLSTARPTQQALATPVSDDVLMLRPKTDAEKHTVVVEARDQSIERAGVAGQKGLAEMPGVDDGGEPLVLETQRPATLPSDGRPVRIETMSTRMDAVVDRVAYPELSEAVHVRALATWNGKVPLLAGPVRLVGGDAAVGAARTPFVGLGEPFELGFGVDDGLRVRRSVQRTKDTVPVTGTQKVTITITDTISNLSNQPKSLLVVERIPKSEISDVKVTCRPDGGTLDDKDGFVRYTLSLTPHEVRTLTLEYRVEAPGRVQLPASIMGYAVGATSSP
jgi:uncharacterized protein (TIGR02231 family)